MNQSFSYFVLFQTFYPNLAGLLACALKITVFVLAGCVVAGWLKRRAATARCWVWRAVIAGCLALPVFDLGAPALAKLRLVWSQQPSAEIVRSFGEQAEAWHVVRSLEDARAERQDKMAVRRPFDGELSPWEAERAKRTEVTVEELRPTPWRQIEEEARSVWWAVAGVVLALMLARILIASRRLRKNACRANDEMQKQAGAVARRLGVRAGVRVWRMASGRSPLMAGLWRPAVYLPEEAVCWDRSCREAVFLHELAHWRRGDQFWQLAGRVAVALWWWHPLVLWAARRMNAEAEEAADDVVLLQHTPADAYARTLVEIASGSHAAIPVGVPMVGYRALEKRIRALLRDNPHRGRVGKRVAVAVMALGFGVLATAAFYVGQAAGGSAAEGGHVAAALSAADRAALKRIEENTLKRLGALRYLHFKLEERVVREEGEGRTWRSPEPTRMEAWVDEWTGVHRVEYRPRVLAYSDQVGEFSVREETAINDGREYFRYDEEDEINRMRAQKPEGLEGYLGLREATDLLRIVRSLLSGGSLVGADFRNSVERAEWQGRPVLQLRQQFIAEGKVSQQTTFFVDTNNEDALVCWELSFPDKYPETKSQWNVQEWERSAAGALYPARYQSVYQRTGFLSMSEVRVTRLEVLAALPAGITERPQSPDEPYISRTGIPKRYPQLVMDYASATKAEPLPSVVVKVRINRGGEVEFRADAAGRVAIPLPTEEITYLSVRAKAEGFAPQVVHWRKQGDPLQLPERYAVKLWRGSPVSGKVIDASGRPVAGAQVELWLRGVGVARGTYVFGDRFDIAGRKTATDADGIWRANDFPDDLRGFGFRISAPGYRATTDSGFSDFRSTTKLPYTVLRDGSWVVTLRRGEILDGVVSDAAGAPVPKARLVVGRDAWGTNLPTTNTDAQGRFVFGGLATGPVVLTVESPWHKPVDVEVTLPLSEPLAIRLAAGNVLRARVVDERGKPCAGLNVGVDTWKTLRTLNFGTQTDADGRFEWRGAPDEAVSFSFGGCQNREFLNGLWLTAGAEEQIVVMKPALRLTATVIDAVTKKPVSHFRLTPGRAWGDSDVSWEKEEAKSYTRGPGVWKTDYMGGRRAFLIEAEGYEPLQTPIYETQQTAVTATYELKAKGAD